MLMGENITPGKQVSHIFVSRVFYTYTHNTLMYIKLNKETQIQRKKNKKVKSMAAVTLGPAKIYFCLLPTSDPRQEARIARRQLMDIKLYWPADRKILE